ncbi:MAG: ADP-ribosylglycohydrolase family protein [Candidatus Lokiarchaeota archaeon]|nr:ADP-ribosylglycohydrolase family protein [Candidatus Lokiarchaeota archaeon]
MIGAISGDVIGSVFEAYPIKNTDFQLFSEYTTFTDDTVLTVAIADAILHKKDYQETLRKYTREHPKRGYGAHYYSWAMSDSIEPYNSWGNGAGMRVSPVGFAFPTLDEVLTEAKKSAEVTHNHPEGIKGAQAVASSIFLAKTRNSKEKIKDYIEKQFKYDLSFTIAEIRPKYYFDVSCQGSVPQAIKSFLESKSYEHCIRLAISLGGDSDTIACMAGGIAQAYYKKIPKKIVIKVRERLPSNFLTIIDEFNDQYKI